MPRRLTYNSVKKFFNDNNYELLNDEYKNSQTHLDVICPKGHNYKVIFGNFKYGGKRCPHCTGNAKLTYIYVKNYIETEDYELISDEYKNSHAKLKIKCPKNHIFEAPFQVFHKGHRCPYCAGLKKYTIEFVKKYIGIFNYKLLSKEYSNCKSKLKLECNMGHKFKTTFYEFKNRDSRCPICYQEQTNSRGIRLIQEYLRNNNIEFKREYKFDDCRYKNTLSFDFAIFENNGLKSIIEFHGKQHYDITDFWYSEDGAKRDQIKVNYCELNNIPFIAIPYNDEHIIGTVHNFIKNIK